MPSAPASEPVDGRTIKFLLAWAKKFGNAAELETIYDKIQRDDPDDLRELNLFTVYHLLYSAAVSEEHISRYLDGVNPPRRIASSKHDKNWNINKLAWRGIGVGNIPNVLGAIAFLVVILFAFESFCKAVLGEKRMKREVKRDHPKKQFSFVSMEVILTWLKDQNAINEDRLHTVEFLNRYRNAWHSSARYNGKTDQCKEIRLRPGKQVPRIDAEKRMEFLDDLLQIFFDVDAFAKAP